ncbi:MAG: hypothetical protein ACTHN5_20275 [Phycisphaerae bacterium]
MKRPALESAPLLHKDALPDRIRNQLLWAFDSAGNLDGDSFLTILKHEHIRLSPSHLLELASDLTARPRPLNTAPHPN